jgi:hypothetical protein
MVSNARELHIHDFGAIEQPDGSYIDEYGTIHWFNEAGDTNRLDGPAIIHTDGSVFWYFNGVFYYSFKLWLNAVPIPDENKMILRLQYG